ncbi:hypothetical protein HY218_01010, partial [Candidatus Saccharibacteria bacterium]|nr:hypothetical protein [Candidatus Saccharibacteria bacterium]
DMKLYPDYWNGISGFLDDQSSVEEKVASELGEELSVHPQDIISLKRGNILIQESHEYQKTWIIFPVLAEIKTTQYTLDWEAQRAQWLKLTEAFKLNLLPGFDEVLRQFF